MPISCEPMEPVEINVVVPACDCPPGTFAAEVAAYREPQDGDVYVEGFFQRPGDDVPSALALFEWWRGPQYDQIRNAIMDGEETVTVMFDVDGHGKEEPLELTRLMQRTWRLRDHQH